MVDDAGAPLDPSTRDPNTPTVHTTSATSWPSEIAVLDAPVSGRGAAAAERKLLVVAPPRCERRGFSLGRLGVATDQPGP